MLFISVLYRRNVDGDEMSSGSGFNRWTEFLLALSLSLSLSLSAERARNFQ